MPRMTRAALRAQGIRIAQEGANSDSTSLHSIEDIKSTTSNDPILTEVSGNGRAMAEDMISEVISEKQTVTRSKGKKLKNALKNIFSTGEDQKPSEISQQSDVKEDSQPPASATIQADSGMPENEPFLQPLPPQDTQLGSVEPTDEAPVEVSATQEVQTPVNHDSTPLETEPQQVRPQTPRVVREEPSNSFTNSLATGKTPKFDPSVHASEIQEQASTDNQDDSFVDSIRTRSPSKQHSMSLEDAPASPEHDSFVDDIQTRSPAKLAARIEDSVEAIDALEEALEQVTRDLPDLNEDILASPVRTKQTAPLVRISVKPSTTIVSQKQRPVKPAPTLSRKPSTIGKNLTQKPKPVVSSRPVSTTFTAASKEAPKTAPPPRISTKATVPKAPLVTNKPAFVPAKSTKPLTKPTFTLPGERMAAKLKAQKEERLKQEEAERAKRAFKARPVPKYASVPVRGTLASKARQSILFDENKNENEHPLFRVRRPSNPEVDVKLNRQSMFNPTLTRTSSTSTRSSRPVSAILSASSSGDLAPKRSSSTSSNTNFPAVANGRSTITKSDMIQQRVRAKEIFGRDKVMKEEMERTKREKEEAAKRARAEAAERGRIASREWAEKQRLKKLGEKKIVSGDMMGFKAIAA